MFHPFRILQIFSYSVRTLCYYSSLYHVNLVSGREWVQDILNIYIAHICKIVESIYKNSDQVLVVSLSIAEAALLIFCAIVDQRENPKQWCI